MSAQNDIIWLNDQWIERHRAHISIDDRGFRYGDGVFETMRIHNGRIYQLSAHLQRLANSLAYSKIAYDITPLAQLITEAIEKNRRNHGIARIIISRGISGHGYLPDFDAPPTVLITTSDLPPTTQKAPIKLWLADQKNPHAHHKTLQGLSATLARIEANEHQCHEALLRNQDSLITECSSHNIFWITNGTLHTPSLESSIIAGTIRSAVLKLSPLPVQEGLYPLEALQHADHVFITNCVSLCQTVESLLPNHWQWQPSPYVDQLNGLLKNAMDAYAT